MLLCAHTSPKSPEKNEHLVRASQGSGITGMQLSNQFSKQFFFKTVEKPRECNNCPL